MASTNREGFGICQFSIQGNHVHLVCEAENSEQLSAGMHGWTIRMVRGLNRLLGRRGRVLADRYHAVLLTTPRQVRNAICYVLQNARKHGERIEPRWGGIDPFSSAWQFDGWADDSWRVHLLPATGPPPVSASRTWLLSTGWRRHRLIGIREYPAAAVDHERS